MKKFNFDDDWSDFVEITLFGETNKVKMCTYNDAKRVEAIQEELNEVGDNDVALESIKFLVDKFKEAGADFTEEQFMDIAPAKMVAIMRMLTRGDVEKDPLDGSGEAS